MSYNLTGIDNVTTLPQLINVANTASNSIFGALLLLAIWIALFAAFKNFDTIDDFILSSFITAIIGGFLWILAWVPSYIGALPLAMFIGSLIYRYFR